MTNFDKYSGLFADRGSFDIPALATAGVIVRPLDTLEVSLQYQHIFYGQVESIANPGTQLQLGIPLGVQWKATPQLVLRAGYSHGSNFTTAQNALFNVRAPATTKNHIALGVGYDITPNWNVGLAYVHAFSNALNGYNQNDPTQSIKLHLVQDEVRSARHIVSDCPPPSQREAPRQRLKKRGRSYPLAIRWAGERGVYGALVQSVIRATGQARTARCG